MLFENTVKIDIKIISKGINLSFNNNLILLSFCL